MDRNAFQFTQSRPVTESLSARRAWIEIHLKGCAGVRALSLSARRAWIEISALCMYSMKQPVALRKESVDRNKSRRDAHQKCYHVALRKESVDRNLPLRAKKNLTSPSLSARRAWIEIRPCWTTRTQRRSLSARRAWIEICCACCFCWLLAVALRKESVDRNTLWEVFYTWIDGVALRKESVDRNFYFADKDCDWVRRSPQGERG